MGFLCSLEKKEKKICDIIEEIFKKSE